MSGYNDSLFWGVKMKCIVAGTVKMQSLITNIVFFFILNTGWISRGRRSEVLSQREPWEKPAGCRRDVLGCRWKSKSPLAEEYTKVLWPVPPI